MSLELVPALPEDVVSIYSLLSGPHVGWNRANDFGPPNLRDIRGILQTSCIALYQVCTEGDDEVVGVCSLFNFQPTDRTCWMDCTVVPDFAGELPATVAQLVGHAFRDWDVRKLYAISHGDEQSLFAAFPAHQLEGILRDRWWDNWRFVDRHITALTVDAWKAHAEASF